MSESERRTRRRDYRPTVEALEALRLFSGTAFALPEAPLAPEVHQAGWPVEGLSPSEADGHSWDLALGSSRVAEFLDRAPDRIVPQEDPADTLAGLDQLQRYLARAWARGGIDPQHYDDCSQAVYLTILEQQGRAGFDRLLGTVGREGIHGVFRRDTPDGPDFFRAVDAVKKRAQRLKPGLPLDEAVDVAAPIRDDQVLWREVLDQAIERSLSPREADLARATLRGETPLEIAAQWGLSAKTVSNEKSRVLNKLRECLLAEMAN